MALTLERPADKSNNTSERIDHILYVLINRWKEVKDIAREIDEMDSYEVFDFLLEWNKVESMWRELNKLLDGGEMDSDQVSLYHALQEIKIENSQNLAYIYSRFSIYAGTPQKNN